MFDCDDGWTASIHFKEHPVSTLIRKICQELICKICRVREALGTAANCLSPPERGEISPKNSRIEPLNHERNAEHRLGSPGKDSKRAETVLGAPVHGEGRGEGF